MRQVILRKSSHPAAGKRLSGQDGHTSCERCNLLSSPFPSFSKFVQEKSIPSPELFHSPTDIQCCICASKSVVGLGFCSARSSLLLQMFLACVKTSRDLCVIVTGTFKAIVPLKTMLPDFHSRCVPQNY